MCDMSLNVTRKRWDRRKNRVDSKIRKLRDRLSTYKVVIFLKCRKFSFFQKIRKVLKMNKPADSEQNCQCDRSFSVSRHPLRLTNTFLCNYSIF